MLASRGASWIEERGLGEQHKWGFGSEVAFGRDNLLQRPTQVDGGGTGALFGGPRDGRVEGIVNLEDSGTILKAPKNLTENRGERRPGYLNKLPWGYISKHNIRFG
jgi:hypothetical protein